MIHLSAVVLWMFIILLIFAILFLKNNFSRFVGAMGENYVKKELSQLDSTRYGVLHDVMIETEPGKTSQIDHVIVSQFGIFVIETKNYAGLIFGKEKDSNWTYVKHRSKYRFLNPILQNQGHMKALHQVLNIPMEVMISVIVFSRESELKIETETPVIYIGELVKHVQSYRKLQITGPESVRLAKMIKLLNITDIGRRKAHVAYAQSSKSKSRHWAK